MDRLDGMISDEFYIEKKREFQNELDDFEIQHRNITLENDMLIDMGVQIIELCKNAYNHYLRADNENKRLLLKILCSNFLYDGSNVVITLKNTLEPMLLGVNFSKCGGYKTTVELFRKILLSA